MPVRNLTRRLGAPALVAVVALVAASCGGDDSSGPTPPPDDGRVGAGADAPSSDDVSPDDHDCAPTEVAFTNDATGVSGTVTSALSKSQFDGGLFEVHIADFDVTPDDLRTWRPVVPEGGNVITVVFTVFNASADPTPIEPGTSVGLTIDPDELTFLVRHFTTDDDWSSAEQIGTISDGTIEVTAVGDAFCFEIDYRDQEKSAVGVVAAPVFERR